MGRRSRQSPAKSCTNKRRYPSRDEAQETLDYLEQEEDDEGFDRPDLKIYHCTFCSGYHFARRKNE